jgi:Protein of unknown function (DUF1552)
MTNSFSRRNVLRGAFGAALSLPMLPSLMTKEAQAAAPKRPPRLLWIHCSNGNLWGKNLFPNVVFNQNKTFVPGHQMSAGPLVASPMGSRHGLSPIMSVSNGTFPSAILKKMNVLRGLDIPMWCGHRPMASLLGNYNHPALGGVIDLVGKSQEQRPSIDQIMAYSPSFYPDLGSIKERVMIATDEPNTSSNWSDPSNRQSAIQSITGMKSSKDLFNAIFIPPDKPRRAPIVDQVLAEYTSLRNGNRRLSSEDKARLDAYVAQVAEMQRSIKATASCQGVTPPTDDSFNHIAKSADNARIWPNLFTDAMLAAFVCGTSRIGLLNLSGSSSASYYFTYTGITNFPGQFDDIHSQVVHFAAAQDKQAILVDIYQFLFEHVVLKAAQKLDAIPNGMGGTLLDDTLVVWTNEFGTDDHSQTTLPAITFGSAAGAFNTGMLCDYRSMQNPKTLYKFAGDASTESNGFGLLYSQFLATVLQAMGVPPREFELWGHKGYGLPYLGGSAPGTLGTFNFKEHYLGTDSPYFARASEPLPFIWA